MAKLRLTKVHMAQEAEERTVIVLAEDAVRGPVTIEIGENDARWLWADLNRTVRAWRSEDGEED